MDVKKSDRPDKMTVYLQDLNKEDRARALLALVNLLGHTDFRPRDCWRLKLGAQFHGRLNLCFNAPVPVPRRCRKRRAG